MQQSPKLEIVMKNYEVTSVYTGRLGLYITAGIQFKGFNFNRNQCIARN